MVTLESDSQTVYAADTVISEGADGGYSHSENYLAVDTDTGPVGLLLTSIQPTVKGVAVVCDGGDDQEIRQRVIQVVSTAFHISERRVCVVKQE
jgi:stage III sporulation protein AG